MRFHSILRATAAVGVAALLAGCSAGSTMVPKPSAPQGSVHSVMDDIPVTTDASTYLNANLNINTGKPFISFYSCPATGPIEYISDYNNSVIEIYAGGFLPGPLGGPPPCGQITAAGGLKKPSGMFVDTNHRLYVANTMGKNILVFPRGSMVPSIAYVDPTGEYPADVTVAEDRTVIASNALGATAGVTGSISTWHVNGAFVGNFPMPLNVKGWFVTVQLDGTLYFNYIDSSGAGQLATGSCPLGACGPFTIYGPTTTRPGGLRSISEDEAPPNVQDVVQIDRSTASLFLYETPLSPVFCTMPASRPDGFDFNAPRTQIFYADGSLNEGREMSFPGCVGNLLVHGLGGGLQIGAAHDPPGAI